MITDIFYFTDNDESEIKLQEIYVLSLAVIGVILFGAVFGMLLTSLGFNTQIGNVLKILNMIFTFLLLTKYAKNNIYILNLKGKPQRF